MNDRDKLINLLEKYLRKNISVEEFVEKYNYLYDIETDYGVLTEYEHMLFRELSIITGRFSPFEEDLKLKNVYFNEADVRKKAEDVYLKLRREK